MPGIKIKRKPFDDVSFTPCGSSPRTCAPRWRSYCRTQPAPAPPSASCTPSATYYFRGRAPPAADFAHTPSPPPGPGPGTHPPLLPLLRHLTLRGVLARLGGALRTSRVSPALHTFALASLPAPAPPPLLALAALLRAATRLSSPAPVPHHARPGTVSTGAHAALPLLAAVALEEATNPSMLPRCSPSCSPDCTHARACTMMPGIKTKRNLAGGPAYGAGASSGSKAKNAKRPRRRPSLSTSLIINTEYKYLILTTAQPRPLLNNTNE
ncbi:hypothetical protein GGX14DRAFT_667184 [Mycena pura]|uniref:Uncharacterized protein n=1 Tax=Mycena pura TaxID=153505 RepID=A0AAD6UZ89_9AGAR|nr:hypothetical protein GGX14DRAFT_667184 [Mycena pura]